MTNEELLAMETRQKDATPDGRVKFISEIIEFDVPKLIAEVRRLQHIISEKPNFEPLKDGSLNIFQRFWESCIGLSEKADFKFIVGHVARLENRQKNAIPALEALLGVSHRLAGCSVENCIPCRENSEALRLAQKALAELRG